MRLTFAAALLTCAAATPVSAQVVRQYSALALSPRGDQIATVESAGAASHGVITLRAAADGHVVRTIDPCAKCSYSGLTYAPDGSLAFLMRDRTAGTVSLAYAGKSVRTVATIRGIAQSPRVAPDGRHIAVLVTVGAAKEAGATQAGVRQVGEIGETSDEQRLAVFPLTGAAIAAEAVKPVSPGGRYVYEYDWTPDSRGFVATTALGNGDNNWWVATLDAIDATTGSVRRIAAPTTQLNFPRISPDGKTVAYIGGLMSDFGAVGGDIWTVPFAGGTPVDATAGRPLTLTSIDWTGTGVRGSSLKGADAGLFALTAKGDGVVWSRPVSFAAGDGRVVYSADGTMVAAVVQDFEHAPAIYAGPVTAPRQITHDNDAVRSIVSARSIAWKNDGYTVQGWLLAPAGANAATRAPMIVDVHGGPSSASTPSFVAAGGFTADLLNAGYYVFYPNPRGSYGQGEAFTAANKRDFGGGDLRDIQAGVDAVIKAAPVDGNRLGLMGGSYGGFMAMWTNTQTDRFKAIVSGAGLSNWISYYGTNGIDQWMLPFFGKTMYDDPKAYEAVSAIYRMKKAKTPTFIYVGERDIEVPPTQSIEYWHALKDQGVPTSLVIYPEEGHAIRAPENTADLRKRAIAWFDRYVKAVK
jgi:dipeptidyl aminopeptidase/acylaminoacyl peptidase